MSTLDLTIIKAKSFNRTMTMGGQYGLSQTDLMASQANQMYGAGMDLQQLTEKKHSSV